MLLEAVRQDGFALHFASSELKADRDVVRVAMQQEGQALESAPPNSRPTATSFWRPCGRTALF